MKKFYLTTPLYYVNDVPHIGHAYTTIAADILARWARLNGRKTFFLTGTDEHGAKIAEAASRRSQDPQTYVNEISAEFKKMWHLLMISNDDFIRTSEIRHKSVVQDVFEELLSKGQIYKGTYEDWYCLHDETYFSEGELLDKKCPSCGRDVQKLKEESYFFRLSAYASRLLELYAKEPDFLSPKNRANEIINFVKSGLQDLSVSRTKVKWGIPVRSDPVHTIYVWFDALINYISALGYSPHETSSLNPDTGWPCDVHLVGKEIFRFHAVIWPAMLMALHIEVPKRIFAHGWWTVDGTKMSKSLGNVVDPAKMAAEYGADAFRYFLFREVPFGSDGDFSEKALLGRYNAELANNLGNLLQRTTTILFKQFNGVIPQSKNQSFLVADVGRYFENCDRCYQAISLGDVLENIFQLMVKTNQYIDQQAPWTLGSDQKDKLGAILVECLRSLKILALSLAPFMPQKAQKIWERLGERGQIQNEGVSVLKHIRETGGVEFFEGQQIVKGDPLFMRKGGRWK